MPQAVPVLEQTVENDSNIERHAPMGKIKDKNS